MMKKQIIGLAAISLVQGASWDSSLKSKDLIETQADIQQKHHHKKHHHKKDAQEEAPSDDKQDKAAEIKEKAPEEKIPVINNDKAAKEKKSSKSIEERVTEVKQKDIKEKNKEIKDNSSEAAEDKAPVAVEEKSELAEASTKKHHHHKKHHQEQEKSFSKDWASLAEKKREGCTSLGCPEGSSAKHMGFTTEEAVSGVKTTGALLDAAMEGGWAQVSKPGSLAEKKREGCTSLGCPEGSAAKNLTFTTEEAVQGTPITGKMLDAATANNWAQVNKSGNSTKDAAPKKLEEKSGAKIGKWTAVSKKNTKSKKDPKDCTSFDCTTFLDKPPKDSVVSPLEHKVPSVIAQIASMGPESAKLVPSESKSKSDPICSSSGWCGPNIPEKPKKGEAGYEVEYKTGVPLDKDIKDSDKNLKDTEGILGPMKMGKTSNAVNLNQIKSKSAVKNQMQAKLMTRNEKAQSFAQLREKMMSNWGTK